MMLLHDQYLYSMSLSLLLLIVTAACAGYLLGKRNSGESSQQTQIEVWCTHAVGAVDQAIKWLLSSGATGSRAQATQGRKSRSDPS